MLVAFLVLETVSQQDGAWVESPKRPHFCENVSAIVCSNIRHSGSIYRWYCGARLSCPSPDSLPHGFLKLILLITFVEFLELTCPIKDKVLDKVLPDEVHEVVWE